jgi:ATPase subunit of ABC transporter with duplicated ATPase domains
MIILQGNKIERSFSGDVLFDNINIQVDEKDRIALVGRNGAGKSTLLKILVGEETPTSGEINTKRDLTLSYLAQDSRFESKNTIFDEMLHVFDDVRGMESRLRKMEINPEITITTAKRPIISKLVLSANGNKSCNVLISSKPRLARFIIMSMIELQEVITKIPAKMVGIFPLV